MEQSIKITTHDTISSIPADAWDALVDSPFLEHAFLQLMEDTGCVGHEAGWIPAYITAQTDDDDAIIGALPYFVKTHSAGEFVFDWGWADAAQRAGIQYYPKAVVAAPVTPVTGRRLLVAKTYPDRAFVQKVLIQGAMEVAKSLNLSSVHFNFVNEDDREAFEEVGLPIRVGTQYHWKNERSADAKPFEDYDDFLSEFRSKRRANLRRERRKLRESGVTTRILTGDDIGPDDLSRMFRYYKSTVDKFYWGRQYLNRAFFDRIADRFRDRLHLVIAERDGVPFAGTFNLMRDRRLYGRYWGCTEDVDYAHFEVCMYTPIEWCIDHGFEAFEPGAGGEHKFERGFTPTKTYSAHFVRNPSLFHAIEMAISDESRAVEFHYDRLREESPMKNPRF